ncbi:MAG TPA: TIGR03435 family protein [Candidatus Acidoferrum sp.]|nr:TIGR03435 family protein [Candidatus Acidoferrum sp.]
MRAILKAAVLGCLLPAVSSGQRPTFDVASVKTVNLASHPVFGNRGGPGTSDPSRIHYCCVGIFSLLMRAYDVEIDQLIGPSWIMENMGPNLYEIDATMPANTSKAQFQLMMQSLLTERFHLEVHRETRSFPGYELVVARDGPGLKEPATRTDASAILPPGPQMLTTLGRGMIRVQAQEKPIGDLVKGMGRLIAQSLGEDMNDFASRKPRVIDRTGLSGKYDFTIEFSCEGCAGMGASMAIANGAVAGSPAVADSVGSGVPNIFVALEKQIGLKLVKTKDLPLDVIVVDHVEKVPTGN